MPMKEIEMKRLIKRDEGFRDRIYTDSVGVSTVGWGHALHHGSKFPLEACEILFDFDFRRAVEDAHRIIQENDLSLNRVREFVIINMCFNMGYRGVCSFKAMLTCMKLTPPNYIAAARQILNSKFARQVGKRATYLAELMERGKL